MDFANTSLIYGAVVLGAALVVFVASLSWLWKCRWRVDSESIRVIDRDDDSLSRSHREFLATCNAEAAKSGEDHIIDLMVVESGLLKIATLTRIPDTPFFVYRYRYCPTGKRLYGLRDSVEVVNAAGRPERRSVTNDQLPLKDHTGHLANTVVLPKNSSLSALVAVSWAMAAQSGTTMSAGQQFAGGETARRHLIEQRAKANLEMLAAGRVVELPTGEFRFSRWICLRQAACNCQPVPYLTSLVRRIRRDKLMRSLRPLLPDDLDADWIIPAVQDRVRTGSTAPLTQP